MLERTTISPNGTPYRTGKALASARLGASFVQLAFCLGVSACAGPVVFIRTDPTLPLAPSVGAAPPEVYVDKRPTQPYQSAGIIEYTGDATLDTVLNAVVKKASEIGCDLVVERSLHVGDANEGVRWTAELEPLRKRPVDLHPTQLLPPSHLVAFGAQPVVVLNQPKPHQQFICGIYPTTIDKRSAEAAAERSRADEAAEKARMEAELATHYQALWDVWVSAHASDSCASALALLNSDSDCAGAVCTAPLRLSGGYQQACNIDATSRIAMHRLRSRWETEAAAGASSCLLEVFRAAQNTTSPVTISPRCTGEGKTEAALRDAVRQRVNSAPSSGAKP